MNYWGQRLNDWTEIPPESGILNPGSKLEWQRYAQWITTDFLAWQASIVNEYKRPDQFVTQDFAGPPRPEVNEFDISKTLDVVAVNPYHHAPQDEYDGEDSSYQGDVGGTHQGRRANNVIVGFKALRIADGGHLQDEMAALQELSVAVEITQINFAMIRAARYPAHGGVQIIARRRQIDGKTHW